RSKETLGLAIPINFCQEQQLKIKWKIHLIKSQTFRNLSRFIFINEFFLNQIFTVRLRSTINY
ncbi:hypothetical protein DXT29_13780, partial [Enterococcus faecalis]|nr:hypothetical protein [Enterococcus faecalis]